MVHFVRECSFRTDHWLSLRDKENVSNCDAVDFGFKRNWKKSCYWAALQRLFAGLRMLFTRAVTTVISSISPPLHFQTFPLVKLAALCYCGPTEHVPILLRAIALRDSTCSESTLLNALRQDYIFFICLFICYIFMILLCCWVATAFKNNQSLYSFRKLDWFCE